MSEPQTIIRAKLTSPEIILSSLLGLIFALPLSKESPIFLGELFAALMVLSTGIIGLLPSVVRKANIGLLVAAMPVMLLGYIISDLIRAPEMADVAKTWARLIFQFVDILAIVTMIRKRPLRYDWIALGYAIGSICFGPLRADGFAWKFDAACPLDLIAGFIAIRTSRPIGGTMLILAGVINLLLDCRSPAAAAFIAGMIYFIGISSKYVRKIGILQIISVCGISMFALSFTSKFLSEKSLARQQQSSQGRSIEIFVIAEECLSSPIIGHGSRYISHDLLNRLDQRSVDAQTWAKREGGRRVTMSPGGHSQVLQTWFEGGALGLCFFGVILYKQLKTLAGLLAQKNIYQASPLLLIAVFVGGWDVLMSPFAGSHRVANAILFGAVIVASQWLTFRQATVNSNGRDIRPMELNARRLNMQLQRS